MKKILPTTAITNELAGSSKFFPKPSKREQDTEALDSKAQSEQVASNQPTKPAPLPKPIHIPETPKDIDEDNQASNEEVRSDVKTSVLHDVNKKRWREIIEETEVHNSSLRMSLTEREQIEDMLRALKRQYKIKTSMNELARLGLLILLHDFKQHGKPSIITDVKTA